MEKSRLRETTLMSYRGKTFQKQNMNVTAIVAWLLVGFNVGIMITFALAFGILPMLFSDFRIERASASGSSQSVLIVTRTPIPTTELPLTPTPTQQLPTATATTVTVTPTATHTPTLSDITATPQVVIKVSRGGSESSTTQATAIAVLPPPPDTFSLTGIKFFQQGWNNCGPANLAMGLSYYGWEGTQEETASVLKPDREDRNVSPQQMIDYVEQYTALSAIWRMDGDIELIKQLIANKFIVIVESGYDPNNGEGWYGHYETIVGYDDTAGTITVYDSYLGRPSNPSLTRSYERFDQDWQAFNRNYIVIYPDFREQELIMLLGDDWIQSNNRRNAIATAQREAAEDGENPFAWFNLGTSLTSVGRYEEAVAAFRKSFELGLPYRMMWYQFAPYEALLQTSRLEDVLSLANQTLRTTRYVEETYYYKGRVYEIQGNFEAAREQYQLALDLNPNYFQAQQALERVS
ncbi:MAG: hypothetical protein CUN55_04535 [Phototrophicales bacterium]|nr:MAG: hypothetical protein CUN55_04535 [Phototrophicales bacterium]